MKDPRYQKRLEKCSQHMKEVELDLLLLTKPSNMFYLTGDGRLCAYTMITKDGIVALGVPVTDIEDVKQLAHFDQIVGFDDEVGMIHSIAHYFERFGITKGTVGLEYTFLTQSMMGMLTHPHAKPEGVVPKDCTHILSEMRLVKEQEEIERIRTIFEKHETEWRARMQEQTAQQMAEFRSDLRVGDSLQNQLEDNSDDQQD